MIVLIAGGLVAAAYYLYPRVELALSTVSTDDAYVNSHATQVAPRITENVREVRVDNNDFVKKGDLLIVLDDAMEQVRVRQAEAAVEVAQKTADQAVAKAQSAVAAARANRFKLAAAIAEVNNQIAGLRVAVARLKEAQAAEQLAKAEADRYAELARRKCGHEGAGRRPPDRLRAGPGADPPGARADPQPPRGPGHPRGAGAGQAPGRRPEGLGPASSRRARPRWASSRSTWPSWA